MKNKSFKNKFVLSSDMVTVEPEPISEPQPVVAPQLPLEEPKKAPVVKEPQEQLSLKISARLKKKFQIWCVQNSKTMTEALEDCLEDFLKDA